jgi:hypothetical protein
MMRAISATTSPVSAETMKIVNTRLVAKVEQRRFGSRRDACAECPGLASSPFEGSRTFGGAYLRNTQAALFIREGSPSDTYSPAISCPRAIRWSLAKFSEAEASSLANFTTTTPEFEFSVHITGAEIPH